MTGSFEEFGLLEKRSVGGIYSVCRDTQKRLEMPVGVSPSRVRILTILSSTPLGGYTAV